MFRRLHRLALVGALSATCRVPPVAAEGPAAAASRSPSVPFAAIVSVKDFGATGDGVTDDTAALQKAIDTAGAGTVLVPRGVYAHTGLTISRSVQIEGVGWDFQGSVLKNVHPSNPGIRIVVPDMIGARLFNLNIKGSAETNPSSTAPGIYVRSEGQTILDRVFVSWSGGAGLQLEGHTSLLTVRDCRFQSNRTDGVYGRAEPAKQLNAINLIGSHFIQNGRHGINLWATGLNIKDGAIQGNAGAGVFLNADDMTTRIASVSDVTISGNWIEGNKLGAIVARTTWDRLPPVTHCLNRLRVYDNVLSLFSPKSGVGAVVSLSGPPGSYRGSYFGRNHIDGRDGLAWVDFGDSQDYLTVFEPALQLEYAGAHKFRNLGGMTVRGQETWTQVRVRHDESVTLASRRDARIQRWDGPLSADHTIRLSTASAVEGDTFRIVRAQAGPNALDIGPGIKRLAAGAAAWADVVFDGKEWVLTAFGQL